MSLQEKLREELDRAIGDGPDHPPVEDRVRAGRRALRRRRAAAAVVAAGAVAVLGTTYAAVAPGTDGRAGEVAVDPKPTEEPWPPPADAWEDRTPVRYMEEELQIATGVVVHEHVENPLGLELPKRSDAFDLTFQGQRQWVFMTGESDGYGFSSTLPGDEWTGFDDWLAEQVAANGGNPWPRTLRLTDDGRVVAVAGAEVVQRTDDPRLPANFAPPGTPTGAAVVTVEGDDTGYFVVWRVVEGELDVVTAPPADVVGATFEEMLSYARAQYATEEGLR